MASYQSPPSSSFSKKVLCWFCSLPLPRFHVCHCCHEEGGHHHCEEYDEMEWVFLLALSLGALFLGILAFICEFHHQFSYLALFFYIGAYILGGWDAAIDTAKHLREGKLDIHFLMLAVAIGAASIGAWREGVLLLFLFSLSGAMEQMAMGRTKKAIHALFKGTPQKARLLEGDQEVDIAVEDLTVGMLLRIKAGEMVPTDIEVLHGESACDESNITGEANPIEKSPGDMIFSGTMNLWGMLDGKVVRPPSESSLQKIIRLIQEAQKMKAPAQRFSDRFGTGYTMLILGICLVMFFVWWLLFHLPPFLDQPNLPSAFYRTMTLLVVASPCALVLSVPSAILSAIASGARKGILYRGGAAVEKLSSVSLVALDKTGTLTSGNLILNQIETFAGQEASLKFIAPILANLSEHPLSRAIHKASRSWNNNGLKKPPLIESTRSFAGKGVEASFEGQTYFLGSLAFIKEKVSLGDQLSQLPPNPTDGTPVVWVAAQQGALLGRFLFADELREEAPVILKQLHKIGIQTAMLTGDHQAAAQYIGNKVGIEHIFYELSPDQKLAAIRSFQQERNVSVAMIGDGVNDAPCIAAADVGVAMGIRGSDAALEQAEIVLMNDSLENFLVARRLSQKAHQIIRQNMVVALGTVVIMVGANFLFPVPLTLGVLAHEGSTLLVVLNSLRLLSL